MPRNWMVDCPVCKYETDASDCGVCGGAREVRMVTFDDHWIERERSRKLREALREIRDGRHGVDRIEVIADQALAGETEGASDA